MTVDPHNLSGAYALDALDDSERGAYEEHIATCPDCAEEVHGFVETATRLGGAVEDRVPPGLRGNVMQAIAATPQERPVTRIDDARPGRTRRVLSRLVLAAAVIAMVAAGVGYAVQRDRNNDLQAQQEQITSVLGAPDAAMRTQKLPDGGTVRVVVSPSQDEAVLLTRDLPALDADQDYQMWTITDDEAASAGLLPSEAQEGTSSQLLSGISGSSAVAITVEPAGGSDQPTTDPIVALNTKA